MEIYADSANLEELKEIERMGILRGITTNPEILSKEVTEPIEVIKRLCENFPNQKVFAQVTGRSVEKMTRQAKGYGAVSPKVVIKIPASLEGIKTICALRKDPAFKNEICATTILTAAQALLCAQAGADYVAPYVEDISNIGYVGMETLGQIIESKRGYETKVLAAAVNRARDMTQAASLGVDIITVTPKALLSVFEKPFPMTEWYLDWFDGKKE